MKLVSEGKTHREIALLLGVTVKTAESHRSNVMLKLRVHSTVELVTYAIRNDIVSSTHSDSRVADSCHEKSLWRLRPVSTSLRLQF